MFDSSSPKTLQDIIKLRFDVRKLASSSQDGKRFFLKTAANNRNFRCLNQLMRGLINLPISVFGSQGTLVHSNSTSLIESDGICTSPF